jgi:ribosomal protein L37AE/L43A
MYRENKTITNSYDEKALFSRGTSSSLYTIVFLSYCRASHCYLSNKSNLYCLITMSFLTSVSRLIGIYLRHALKVLSRIILQHRTNTMTKCTLCNAEVHPLRIQAGIYTCLHCGDKQAKQRKHCIVPMHKSNYIVVTNHDDLVRINNKSG